MGMGCWTWGKRSEALPPMIWVGELAEREFRMGGLEVAQFLHQRVVLAVADDWSVVVVVPVVVEPQLIAQLLGAPDGGQAVGVFWWRGSHMLHHPALQHRGLSTV